MSLVVTVRTPDGVVLAADTLTSTMTQHPGSPAQGQPSPVIRSLTLSTTATKIFPYLDMFGVGAVGNSLAGGQSLGMVLRELEDDLLQAGTMERTGLKTAAEKVSARVREKMKGEAGQINMLICGFEAGEFSTVDVTVRDGDIRAKDPIRGGGVTVAGENSVVTALWGLAKTRNTSGGHRVATCRDAADYATFLIRTTRDYQHFFTEPQTVGGGIDIGLVDRRRKFRWLKRSSHATPENGM